MLCAFVVCVIKTSLHQQIYSIVRVQSLQANDVRYSHKINNEVAAVGTAAFKGQSSKFKVKCDNRTHNVRVVLVVVGIAICEVDVPRVVGRVLRGRPSVRLV